MRTAWRSPDHFEVACSECLEKYPFGPLRELMKPGCGRYLLFQHSLEEADVQARRCLPANFPRLGWTPAVAFGFVLLLGKQVVGGRTDISQETGQRKADVAGKALVGHRCGLGWGIASVMVEPPKRQLLAVVLYSVLRRRHQMMALILTQRQQTPP